MKDIQQLPSEILFVIADYLWGNTMNWKKRLDIMNIIPSYTTHFKLLKDVKQYNKCGKIIESEDSLYCKYCGEKSVFFALEECEMCGNLNRRWYIG